MRSWLVAVGMTFGVAAAEIQVPGDWLRLPPKDVDPALAETANPIPRPWSGQKAALRFSTVQHEGNALVLDWSAAAPEMKKPKLKADPQGLWAKKLEAAPKDPVTRPRVIAVGRDFRFFREFAFGQTYGFRRDRLPETENLLPFVVVVDGNNEDGYGGYVLGFDTAGAWTYERTEEGLRLTAAQDDASPIALRFDGTWLAGVQKLVRSLSAYPQVEAKVAARVVDLLPQRNMDAELLLTVISEWIQDDAKWNWACAPAAWDAYLKRRLARRAKLLADPRLKETLNKGILFNTRRSTTWNHCVAQYFGWRQRPGGSLLVLEEPGRSLRTRDLIAGQLPPGTFLEPRLSFDAQRILFAYVETQGPLNPYSMKVNEEGEDDHYFHLWETTPAGGPPRQLTKGVYEDFMPEFLPDGDIVFMSTRRKSQSRCFWYGYSNRWQAYTLFRMQGDGTNIRQLSWNDVAEWFPTLANNGELLLARWDYIDRDAVRHQNLWSLRPDGTNPKAIWGNETTDPHCTFQIRAIPGSTKIACIASAHHACTGGPLILVDPAVDENSERAITHVTPGHYPEIDLDDPRLTSAEAHNDWYNSPWPYAEDLFLVCWSRDPLQYEPTRPAPDASLGLYVLAADGTRELLWRDGFINAMSPIPLVPRAVPPKLESPLDPVLKEAQEGEVFISDVSRGLKLAKPGSLAEIRVVQVFPRTAPDQYLPNVGRGGHENARAVLGTVDVEADGSARFIVPAGRPILFQVLDREGFAWRTMRSTTSVMPGERVSCVGCHESKREASSAAASISLAMKKPAQRLKATPESGRPWGFVENIQPIFDAKCVRCHSDENPAAGISLTRTVDARFGKGETVVETGDRMYCAPFTKSYTTLCYTDQPTRRKFPSGFFKPFQAYVPRKGRSREGKVVEMVPCWPEYNTVQTTPEGPGVNALGSGLIGRLSRGGHARMLEPEELRLIATWLDLNATFYGCTEEPNLTRQLNGEPITMPPWW